MDPVIETDLPQILLQSDSFAPGFSKAARKSPRAPDTASPRLFQNGNNLPVAEKNRNTIDLLAVRDFRNRGKTLKSKNAFVSGIDRDDLARVA